MLQLNDSPLVGKPFAHAPFFRKWPTVVTSQRRQLIHQTQSFATTASFLSHQRTDLR